MYAGAVYGLYVRVRVVVKKSIGVFIVGVFPCTQLAGAGHGLH